jgi:hypothetical protein
LIRHEKSVRFLTIFGLSAGFLLALRHFELNLTSDDAAIYHSKRWGEAKSLAERSFGQDSKKRNSYLQEEHPMTDSFQFCVQCGAKVAPYAALDGSTEDAYVLGKQAVERNTYFCPQCKVRRLRPNPKETGESCPGCQQQVSYECSHCPRCGQKQRWARATASPRGAEPEP